MPKLLLASNNAGKLKEYQSLLSGCGFEVVTPAELGIKITVAETGTTFEENARLKAAALAEASGLLTLADDSGLEVDALGGEPGLYSARYAGENATDTDRNDYLLSKMEDIPANKRTARFRCVIAIVQPGHTLPAIEGSCEGLIATEPHGVNGFGYDPIFYLPEYRKTMAELPLEIKNSLSHRAIAAQKACLMLAKLANC
ncbi:XTP/dITP diphosphatase [Dehalococcoides mccartyi]|uniref:XTP/dITP diphosphatase n=1 Tax=Dehalococcoides mccartyi TaxID=61435 RepID=UPI0001BDC92B|nr:XTP/dITP diphosphatase [Dehalococcoides mccartyi]AQU06223.1 non-canonical purine NTP pyrophosphatase [Dehalococcoides mccartyi]AQU07666.1 non-canonical purine NTP pyrophosphatase [Dehalococcoides mccartyi]AQW62696.1 non-canonical purine NTP pyrophosphatase [Dehalococcoides mccartyi]AQX73487.1 non-canonical purine NTP pyrophosphatase [Dehalococcoides mccartyi]